VTAIFQPFILGVHRVHIMMSCEEFGEFVYEVIGTVTPPSTTHVFKLQAENQPGVIMKELLLPFVNETLEKVG
jgi:hypothetical protein